MLSGMAGLSAAVRFSPLVLLVVLAAWPAVPLGIATAAFKRREARRTRATFARKNDN
jgi:hypothetical protein